MNMSIGNASHSASLGLQTGAQSIQRSAAQIASAENLSGGDNIKQLTEALLTMKNGEQQASAGVKMLQSADEMLGSLFDDHA